MRMFMFCGLIFTSVNVVYGGEYCTYGSDKTFCSIGCCKGGCCETIVIWSSVGCGGLLIIMVVVTLLCCFYKSEICCFKKRRSPYHAKPRHKNGQILKAPISTIPFDNKMTYPQGGNVNVSYPASSMQQHDRADQLPPPTPVEHKDGFTGGRPGSNRFPHPHKDTRQLQGPPERDNEQWGPVNRYQEQGDSAFDKCTPWQLKPHPLTSPLPNLAENTLPGGPANMDSPINNVCTSCQEYAQRSQFREKRTNAYSKRQEHDRRSQLSGTRSISFLEKPEYCTRCGRSNHTMDIRPRPASFSPLHGASGEPYAYRPRENPRVDGGSVYQDYGRQRDGNWGHQYRFHEFDAGVDYNGRTQC